MKHLFTFFCILLFTVAIFGDDSEQEIEYYTYDQQVDSTGDYDSAYDDAYNGGYDDSQGGDDTYDDGEGDRRKRDVESSEDYEIYRYK